VQEVWQAGARAAFLSRHEWEIRLGRLEAGEGQKAEEGEAEDWDHGGMMELGSLSVAESFRQFFFQGLPSVGQSPTKSRSPQKL
jgi:hypothetical protein